jgi:hypothetical protein
MFLKFDLPLKKEADYVQCKGEMNKPMGLYIDYCIAYQNYGYLFLPVTSYEIRGKFVS